MANGVQAELAVLIDADNASAKSSDRLFEEIARLGTATVRRAYGDFGQGQAKSWQPALMKHAIVPQQHFANVRGKNATDIALVVDAMDLMHTGRLDGICLVSSDSDYTRLATRLREQGLKVFVFGTASVAAGLRQACYQYIEIEVPKPAVAAKAAASAKAGVPSARKATKLDASNAKVSSAKDLLLRAMARMSGAEWVPLTALLKEVRAVQPQFEAKAYGSAKPIALVRKTGCFDDEMRGGTMMVRKKPTALAVAKAAKAA